MDLDVFTAVHGAEWQRLEALVRRRRLSGAEADELVALYQKAATHLSLVQSAGPDPALVARLTTLVARARSAVTAPRTGGWHDAARYFTTAFPAAVYRARSWWLGTALVSVVLIALVSWWIAADPAVRGTIAAPAQVRQMTRVGGEYQAYYSSHPATAFAAQVWTNNAWAVATCLAFGALLGLPVLFVLAVNILNVGVGIGLMASAGRLAFFMGLLLPHGLLELTAVFIAAGVGLRLGWTVVDPGPRTRAAALAQEGRTAIGMVVGLASMLLVSGILEAFLTPSPLPTAARVGTGAGVEALFLLYVFTLGRRAAAAGETGDVEAADRTDELPAAA